MRTTVILSVATVAQRCGISADIAARIKVREREGVLDYLMKIRQIAVKGAWFLCVTLKYLLLVSP